MRFVNLTGHPVDVVREDGTLITLWPDVFTVRATLRYRLLEVLDGIGIYVQETACAVELPDPDPGIRYVVSVYTKLHFLDREDVLCPAQLHRDAETGRVISSHGLQQIFGAEEGPNNDPTE